MIYAPNNLKHFNGLFKKYTLMEKKKKKFFFYSQWKEVFTGIA